MAMFLFFILKNLLIFREKKIVDIFVSTSVVGVK